MGETYSEFCKQTAESIGKEIATRPLHIIHTVNGGFAVYMLAADDEAAKANETKLRTNEKLAPWIERVEAVERDSWMGKEIERVTEELWESLPGVFFGSAHLDKLNWFYRGARFELPKKTPIICFFSFKGGVGRTTTAALTALALARTGKRVAVLDFDFEAPGLATLFATDDADYEQVGGVLDFIQPLPASAPPLKLSDHYFKVQEQALTGGGEVLVFPAAKMKGAEEDYLNLLSRVHLALNSSRTARIELLLGSIEEELEPDIILLDSRTGFNDIAGFLLGRYASHAVLFFFGSRQNMFGLEATLPHLRDQEVDFTLVHSPIPAVPELAEEAKSEFLSRSYEAFCKYVYLDGSVPGIMDSNERHYPLEIHWSEAAILPNRNRLKALLNGGATPYAKLAVRLLGDTGKSSVPLAVSAATATNEQAAIQALSGILEGAVVGDGTIEFNDSEKLKRNFFPRKDYKFIFTPRTFLVLGEKGAGKTALFVALTAGGGFYNALREYCGGSDQNSHWKFIAAMSKQQGFPSKQDFRGLNTLKSAALETYWILLLVKQIKSSEEAFAQPIPEPLKQALDAPYSKWPQSASDSGIGSVAMEWLQSLDQDLANQNKQMFMVYDYLDSEIPTDDGLRGRVVGALLALWQDLTERFKCLRAKILLRKDIFEREVGDGITDKAKLKNFAVNLEWSYEQLLNLVWKRWIAHSPKVRELYFHKFTEAFDESQQAQFGVIPQLTEEQSGEVLVQLLGAKMGANNQAHPLNWVRIHLSDGNNHIVPRSILTLFAKSAAFQFADTESNADSGVLIKSRHLDKAGADVSETRARDLREEYPELASALDKLKSLVRFPQPDDAVRTALGDETDVAGIIQKLKDIGVLFPYKAAGKKGEQRLHIPDVYLNGLGLQRIGPGAQKAVAKRKR